MNPLIPNDKNINHKFPKKISKNNFPKIFMNKNNFFKILLAFDSFQDDFKNSSYLYSTEKDIQSALFIKLLSQFKGFPRLEVYDSRLAGLACGQVTSEYAYFGQNPGGKYYRDKNMRLDLAILDAELASKAISIMEDNNIDLRKIYGWLPVEFGIEIKYERNNNIMNEASKLGNDYQYCNDNDFRGIAVHYFQYDLKSNEKDKNFFRDKGFIEITKFQDLAELDDAWKVMIFVTFTDSIFYKLAENIRFLKAD